MLNFEKLSAQGMQSLEYQKSINRHLRMIKLVQLKNILGSDNVFTFYHEDVRVKFSLTSVPYDHIENIILETGQFYEIRLLEQIRKFIRSDSVIADIGANIGNHSVYFSVICKCKFVYAFEPQVPAFEALKTNLQLNKIDNCSCSRLLLSTDEGNASIRTWSAGNLGATAFTENPTGNYPVSTLDRFSFEKLDFIKMDVEDMEYKVLCGAEQTIKKFKPILWLELKTKKQQQDAATLLRNWGYGSPTSIASHSYAWLFLPEHTGSSTRRSINNEEKQTIVAKCPAISSPCDDAMRLIPELKGSQNRPITVAEIGVGVGATTSAILKLLTPFDTLYLFDFEDSLAELCSDIERERLAEGINIIPLSNSRHTLDSYCWSLGKLFLDKANSGKTTEFFDLVYLDGTHCFAFDALAAYILKDMIVPGGYLVFDDLFWTQQSFADRYLSQKSTVEALYSKEQREAAQVSFAIDVVMHKSKNFIRDKMDTCNKNIAIFKKVYD